MTHLLIDSPLHFETAHTRPDTHTHIHTHTNMHAPAPPKKSVISITA